MPRYDAHPLDFVVNLIVPEGSAASFDTISGVSSADSIFIFGEERTEKKNQVSDTQCLSGRKALLDAAGRDLLQT